MAVCISGVINIRISKTCTVYIIFWARHARLNVILKLTNVENWVTNWLVFLKQKYVY
jgi:hypothetical protein